LRAKQKSKEEAKKEKKQLQRDEQKAAKDLDKANAAQNTTDLIIPEPKFVVGSHVKSKIKTCPGTNSKESVSVDGNIIYKYYFC
jgi:hypothetical protein